MKSSFINDFEFTGQVTSIPDYHGIFEIYLLEQVLPTFKITNGKPNYKQECIKFLNKLIDVVRVCTSKYCILFFKISKLFMCQSY
jgi:hypothetical protein